MSLLIQMSKDLRLDEEYIINVASKNNRYKRYMIGSREVFHPSKELKTLQYWIVNKVFAEFPISTFCMAYQKGCSIKKNADVHKGSNYILHTDIEKFFNNINATHLEQLLQNRNLSNDDINLIEKIVLYKGHLVIGSVASPVISNCIMYNFDNELFKKLSKDYNIKYTRYADDIIISSPDYIPKEIIDIIACILDKYGFSINRKKTYFMSRKSRRIVTGVTIDNNSDRLTLGYRRHKMIKKMIYNKLVKNQGDENKIKGYLAFLKDIDEEYYFKLKDTYKRYGDVSILFDGG